MFDQDVGFHQIITRHYLFTLDSSPEFKCIKLVQQSKTKIKWGEVRIQLNKYKFLYLLTPTDQSLHKTFDNLFAGFKTTAVSMKYLVITQPWVPCHISTLTIFSTTVGESCCSILRWKLSLRLNYMKMSTVLKHSFLFSEGKYSNRLAVLYTCKKIAISLLCCLRECYA